MLNILKLNNKSKAGKQHFAYEVKTYAINQRIMIIICTSGLFTKMQLYIPNAALHGHVKGKRSRGRQRKTWMDNVREDLKERNIDLTRIGEATRNREVWRNLVRASSSAR